MEPPWVLYVSTLRSVLSQLNPVCIFLSLCNILLRIVRLPVLITDSYNLRHRSCHHVIIDAVHCLLTRPITRLLTVIIIQLIMYLAVVFQAVTSSHFLSQPHSWCLSVSSTLLWLCLVVVSIYSFRSWL